MHFQTVAGVFGAAETTMADHMCGVRAAFFYAEVTTARLNKITALIDSGKLSTDVGTVLPLDQVRTAHEMLAGAPHKRGKIVLIT